MIRSLLSLVVICVFSLYALVRLDVLPASPEDLDLELLGNKPLFKSPDKQRFTDRIAGRIWEE